MCLFVVEFGIVDSMPKEIDCILGLDSGLSVVDIEERTAKIRGSAVSFNILKQEQSSERIMIERLGFPMDNILGNTGLENSIGSPNAEGQLEIRIPTPSVWIGTNPPQDLPDFVIDLYTVLIFLQDA
jgi:hypothetical protein